MATHVLTLSCPDRSGIVHAVTGTVGEVGGNIVESQQYGDPDTSRFFMRVAISPVEGAHDPQACRSFGKVFTEAFLPVAQRFGMEWQLHDTVTPTRTLIMVSRDGHCLNDLLFRVRIGSLPLEVRAVVGNHDTLADIADFYSVPFHHLPVGGGTEGKQAAEEQLRGLITHHDVELVVLARYMQILSDPLCRELSGRVINIHHSFLPSFKGARPYHQAHERGVKLIGATAHYVTADLDEGPIIEQDVARVGHSMTPEDLAAVGRDVEAQVLARAVRWHVERRVLMNGRSTVVFT